MSDKIVVYTQAHNAEKTLSRTLDSVLAQTRRDFVYYVADNYSDDHTREILNSYASKDERIRPIYYDQDDHTGSGVCRLFQTVSWLVGHAEFDWLCILDADDTYQPEFLRSMLSFAQENSLDMACCGSVFIDAATGKELGGRTVPADMIIEKDGFGTLFPAYHQFMRTWWAKLVSRGVLEKADMDRLNNRSIGADTMLCFEWLRRCERVGVSAKNLHNYYLSKTSNSYKLDINRIGADAIQHRDTVDFLMEKAGQISPQNRAFLADVYSNGVRDTVGVVNHANLSKADKLREYRRLAEHPVTTENFRFASGDVLRARKSLLAGALSCHDAEGETAAEDFRAILALCAPKCAAALTPESVSLLAQKNLLDALLNDDAGALLAALLGMIRASENSKKYDLCAMVRALSADKPLLKDVGEKKFLRRYGDIYLAVWRDDHGTALKEMTELLLKGEKTDEAFLQLYLTLAALHELTEAFVFGKKKLAACRLRAGDKEGCRAVLDELAEMGAGNDPELESLRAKL